MAITTFPSSRVPDRRTAGREMVGRLLEERQRMLVLFCRAAGLEPYPDGRRDDRGVPQVLQEFCQVLVDYVAAAHFSLYERIVNGTERRQRVIDLARELYARIEQCTESAIVFNDKYDCADQCQELTQLHADLCELGEALATRIELEDRLIEGLLGPRSSPA